MFRILSSLPPKSSPVDYIPTSLLKTCSTVFSELISILANLSFSQGSFPTKFKFAAVSPLLKKTGLDADDPSNFRPISNLNNISKILERLFLTRLLPHVTASPNFNQLQSAYRQHHSTETALLATLDNIYRSSDNGKPSVLISLDLSAAFDMIDHNLLSSRLHTSFGITGTALQFIKSYLTDRSQCVRAGKASSSPTSCNTGVPQGSVLVVSSTPHYAMQAKPSPSGSVIGKSKQPESILVPVTSLQRHNRCVDFVTIYISKVF